MIHHALRIVCAALLGCSGPPPASTCSAGEGTEACACRGGDTCDEGLFCDEGLCRPLGESLVAVSDADARSCEVLLEERSGQVFDAVFEGSLGALVREAPRVSLAFSRTEDSAFADGAVSVRHSEGAALAIVRAQCFDSQGDPLATDSVRLR